MSIGALAPLGLDAASTLAVTEALTGTSLGARAGADLLTGGIDVTLPRYGTAVVVLTPQ